MNGMNGKVDRSEELLVNILSSEDEIANGRQYHESGS